LILTKACIAWWNERTADHTSESAFATDSASRNASLMPWAVMGSLLYAASPTRTQPLPYGLRR
jgi:hypothetical protein